MTKVENLLFLNYFCRENIRDGMNQVHMGKVFRLDPVTKKRKLKLIKDGRDKDSMRKYAKEYHFTVKLMVSFHIMGLCKIDS